MVDVRVNLLKNRKVLSEKDYQRERAILQWSVVAMVVVLVIVLALSVWTYILTKQLSTIEKQMVASSKEMQGLVQASAQQIYLKSRLQLVKGFLTDRSLMRKALQKILSTNIPNTHIAGLEFLDPTSLGVSVVADDVRSLDVLLTYFQGDTDYFTQVVSRGLTRTRDGSYQLNMELSLPPGGE